MGLNKALKSILCTDCNSNERRASFTEDESIQVFMTFEYYMKPPTTHKRPLFHLFVYMFYLKMQGRLIPKLANHAPSAIAADAKRFHVGVSSRLCAVHSTLCAHTSCSYSCSTGALFPVESCLLGMYVHYVEFCRSYPTICTMKMRWGANKRATWMQKGKVTKLNSISA